MGTSGRSDLREGKKSFTFEEAFHTAEQSVAALEDGSLTLEKCLEEYQEGRGALDRCYSVLRAAQKRVEVLGAEVDLEQADLHQGETAEIFDDSKNPSDRASPDLGLADGRGEAEAANSASGRPKATGRTGKGASARKRGRSRKVDEADDAWRPASSVKPLEDALDRIDREQASSEGDD